MKIWILLLFLSVINKKALAWQIIVPSNIQIQEDYYESLLNEYLYKNWAKQKIVEFYYPNMEKVKVAYNL